MPVTVDVSGVVGKMRSLAEMRGAQRAGQTAGSMVRQRAATYPPQSHKPQPLKTRRSQRFFFAALRDGRISVPYKRTLRLGAGWSVRIDGLNVTIFNNEPHAAIVQKAGAQSGYHLGHWSNEVQIAEEMTPVVLAIYEREMHAEISA